MPKEELTPEQEIQHHFYVAICDLADELTEDGYSQLEISNGCHLFVLQIICMAAATVKDQKKYLITLTKEIAMNLKKVKDQMNDDKEKFLMEQHDET